MTKSKADEEILKENGSLLMWRKQVADTPRKGIFCLEHGFRMRACNECITQVRETAHWQGKSEAQREIAELSVARGSHVAASSDELACRKAKGKSASLNEIAKGSGVSRCAVLGVLNYLEKKGIITSQMVHVNYSEKGVQKYQREYEQGKAENKKVG
jgi:hypothetical protein